MEIMTIESNAYRLLVEKIEKITAYVEESRNREETERKRKEEAESPATKGRKADPKWMTHKEVCEALDISHRTLQRYRQKNIVPYCNLQIFLCLFLEKLNMPQNTPVTKAS